MCARRSAHARGALFLLFFYPGLLKFYRENKVSQRRWSNMNTFTNEYHARLHARVRGYVRVGGGTGVGRPGVAGAGFGALANSHLRRQMGQVFLLCSHVLMHMRWK